MSSYSTGCGDSGDDMGPFGYDGTTTMLFPASGCRASYTGTGATTIGSARAAAGCAGTLTVAGTTTGVATVPGGTWATVAVIPPAASLPARTP